MKGRKDWDIFEDVFIFFTVPPLLSFIFYGDLSRFISKLSFTFFALILFIILLKVIFNFLKIERKEYKKYFFLPFIILGLSFFINKIPINSKNILLALTVGFLYIIFIKGIIKLIMKLTITQKNKTIDI